MAIQLCLFCGSGNTPRPKRRAGAERARSAVHDEPFPNPPAEEPRRTAARRRPHVRHWAGCPGGGRRTSSAMGVLIASVRRPAGTEGARRSPRPPASAPSPGTRASLQAGPYDASPCSGLAEVWHSYRTRVHVCLAASVQYSATYRTRLPAGPRGRCPARGGHESRPRAAGSSGDAPTPPLRSGRRLSVRCLLLAASPSPCQPCCCCWPGHSRRPGCSALAAMRLLAHARMHRRLFPPPFPGYSGRRLSAHPAIYRARRRRARPGSSA